MLAKKKKKGGGGGGDAKVEVVLNALVKGVGAKGELVKVKPAYAENVLVPQGLATVATPEVLAKIKADEEAAAAAAIAARETAEENLSVLNSVFGDGGLRLQKKCGPTGAIFGKITAAEVAASIKEKTGIELDKRTISMPPLAAVGTGVAQIKLHREVTMKLKLVVEAA